MVHVFKYIYVSCFLDKKFYQGSKEETLELKWGDLYITVNFFSNWQCLGFKQNKVPVNVKLNHKDLRFLLYGNRELKFFYAINMHSESMNHALLLLRDRVFCCQACSSRLLVETWCGAPLGLLLVHRALLHSPLVLPTSPALTRFLLVLFFTPYPVLDGSMWHAALTLFH